MLASIVRSLETHAARNAFFIESKYYTYGELAGRIAASQKALQDVRRNGEKFIGVVTNNDFQTYASVLGILFSGAAYVPLNPGNPIERSLDIIGQAGIKSIVASRRDALTERLEKDNGRTRVFYPDSFPAAGEPVAIPALSGDEAAYMLFTSGSTGVPKGVPISFRNIETFIDAFFALGYQLDETDRFLQMFDLTFDLSVMSYLVPLTLGACVYTVPENEIKYLAVYQLLEDQQITFALMVPSILAYMRAYFEDIRLDSLRYSLFCGEALHEDLAREWRACVPNARIQNVYGPTEATIFCLAYDWIRESSEKKSVNGIVSIGKPMQHTHAIVVDDRLMPLAPGTQGELCLAGTQLTTGYWNNPEKNKEAFFTSPQQENRRFYRTGDFAYIDSEGDFVFCGRVDYQVKIQGYRVELHEIEHHARQYPERRNVVAVAYRNPTGNTSIHLFVENGGECAADLIDFLKTRLPYYMIPSSVTSLDQLPLNSNGKTDRKKLLELIDAKS